jgi:outer membrane lipoprotein carrier protein
MALRLTLAVIAGFLSYGPQIHGVDISSLLRHFEETYRASRTLRATFLERYFDNGKEVRSEAGVAYFARPGKMRWEYASPEVNLYVVDGKWAWFYVPGDHTVTRIRAKESSDARTPLALLAGEMKVARVCKSVNSDSTVRPLDPRGVVLRCNLRVSEKAGTGDANSSDNALSSHGAYALFELNPANGELLRVLMVDPGGVQVEFQFNDWVFNVPLEDAKFHFQAPKGVAIVDGDLATTPDAGFPKGVR